MTSNPERRREDCSQRLRTCALLLLCALSLPGSAPAQTTHTEAEVKAAYLFKFGAFVTWPNPSPNPEFAVCVLGRDPFGSALDATLQGESIDGKRVTALRIQSPDEAAKCRILFISDSEEGRLRSLLTQLARVPVLTVSDIQNFTETGGMIQFVLENGRVRFKVNLGSSEKAGLALSSQLLKVATDVKRSGGRD